MKRQKGIINLTPVLLILIALGVFYFIFRPKTPDYSSRLKETAQLQKEEVVTAPHDWPVYVDNNLGFKFNYPPDLNIITPNKEAKPGDLYISQSLLALENYLEENPGKFDLTNKTEKIIDSKTVFRVGGTDVYRREHIILPARSGTAIIGATFPKDAQKTETKIIDQILSSIKFTE